MDEEEVEVEECGGGTRGERASSSINNSAFNSKQHGIGCHLFGLVKSSNCMISLTDLSLSPPILLPRVETINGGDRFDWTGRRGCLACWI